MKNTASNSKKKSHAIFNDVVAQFENSMNRFLRKNPKLKTKLDIYISKNIPTAGNDIK
jgi:hypothetical protein